MAESMTKYFILRDARLDGKLPFMAAALITSQVDASTSLTTAFARIRMAAQMNGKIKSLFILCHGWGTGPGDIDLWWHGGMGLQLGKEGLKTANVSSWAAIKDCVENIVVYACGAAYTGPTWTAPYANDGQSLMKSLAKHTNAVVYAADRIQTYYTDDLNFGKWEGTVYMFFPTGIVLPNFQPPAHIIDVTAPTPKSSGGYKGHVNDLVLEMRRNR